jgi:hypothetical protein
VTKDERQRVASGALVKINYALTELESAIMLLILAEIPVAKEWRKAYLRTQDLYNATEPHEMGIQQP